MERTLTPLRQCPEVVFWKTAEVVLTFNFLQILIVGYVPV